jgi:hypothetical protein
MLIDIATRRSPKYWHDCAAHVRTMIVTEPNPHLQKLMEGCADDYERLAKRAEQALHDKYVRVF